MFLFKEKLEADERSYFDEYEDLYSDSYDEQLWRNKEIALTNIEIEAQVRKYGEAM